MEPAAEDAALLDAGLAQRPALFLARLLLGSKLCLGLHKSEVRRFIITETEAYTGAEDKACHASKGRTARTEVMFRPGGCWYIYLCYGVHEMLNLVCGKAGEPAAVLIRGAGNFAGPGRLTAALGIDRLLNGSPCDVSTGLWIELGKSVAEEEVLRLPRVGVAYAGEDWATRPYRFIWTSRWPGKLSKVKGLQESQENHRALSFKPSSGTTSETKA
jgi:DNA-3-methyladenine glycosylase